MHNLSIKNGKAEMAYSGATPWHGRVKARALDLALARVS